MARVTRQRSEEKTAVARVVVALVGVALALGCARTHRAASTETTPPVDTIVTNAVVYTLDPERPTAEALAIAGTRIVRVGTAAEVVADRGTARVVDLGGALVLPGFHDGHVHPVTGGIELGQCNLNDLETVEAIEQAVARCRDAQPDAGWLVGGGWDLTLFPDANPTRARLDAIVSDRPVYLTGADAHSAWVNSEALRRAGITAQTPDPARGRIERDESGAPSGTLREGAMALVARRVPPPTPADHVAGLRRGLAMANRFGITSLHEANADAGMLAAYDELARRGELTARVVAAQSIDLEHGPDQLDDLARRRDAIDHERLRATAIKIFVDGVIESRTAALLEPYIGLGHAGDPSLTQEELDALVTGAEARGFDVHVHAIGDRAVRMALDAFARAVHAAPDRDRRHCIAHLQLIDPADIPRFRALGVIANFQPLWAYADSYITDLTIPVLGEARSRWLYPIASVMSTDAVVVAGSDWSVSSMDPLRAIEVAITRRGIEQTMPALHPEEAVALADILDAYTRAGAFLLRQENEVGMLRAGFRADLVVLDRNLFDLDATRIHQAGVVATVLDGEVVYAAQGAPFRPPAGG